MAFGAQPQQSQSSGPSAEQMAISQMGQFAQQPNSLAGILSQLNAITAPTMSPYGGGGTNVVVMPQTQLTTSRSGGAQGAAQAGANGAGAASQASTPLSSSQLSSLGSKLADLLKGGGSVPTGMAGTALGGAGLPSGLTAAQQANLASAFTAPAVSGSLADAMGLTAGSLAPLTAAELAPVGTGAITAAGNAVGASAASELSSALGAQAAPAAAAPAASSASAAGGMGAGALAADAGALGALGWMGYNATHGPANNGWSLGAMTQLLNSTRQATNSGLIGPAQGITGTAGSINAFNPNGTINQPLMSAVQNLQQLQLGDFGPATQSYIKPALNAMGYQNIQQAAAGKQLSGGSPASSSGAALRLIKRY